MRTRPEPQEWYFFKAGTDAGLKAGPFSWDGLVQQAQKGILEPTDVVWDPTSGWQTAEKVPGLFGSDVAGGAGEPGPKKAKANTKAKAKAETKAKAKVKAPPPSPSQKDRKGGRWSYWVVALAALAVIAVVLGVYFGAFYDREGDTVTTESTIASTTESTTTSTTESTTTSTTESTTTTVADDGSGGDGSVVLLGKSQSGHEVFLRPGERVRVELEPYAGDRVSEVHWNYTPSELTSVKEVDSGTEVIGGIVVGCWLELEAVVAGPVTVRAEYVLPKGVTRTTWVIYLFVID